MKGRPNLTTGMFCQWVNDILLPNEILIPGFPRSISVETGRIWMHEMGFEVVLAKKGTFVDGHERDDVVAFRKIFLHKLVALGFLNANNAPTVEARNALPVDLESLNEAIIDRTGFSMTSQHFKAVTTRPHSGEPRTHTLCVPRAKELVLWSQDFICEQQGYLALTSEEYEAAKLTGNTRIQAGEFLVIWGGKRRILDRREIHQAIRNCCTIAEIKYPITEGWKHVWVFDHSSCHAAMANDALDVNKMNVNPGGKQRIMRDGWWGGKPQAMNFALDVPKGL